MKRKDFFSFFIFLAFFVMPFGFAHAENIDPQNAGYKYAKFLDDDSQISFDCTNCNVEVTSSEVTGHAWSENYGWINLQPDNSGVVNDGSGNLSGYAWGETTGWINFNPTNGGVSISSGEFDGHAWSENYGWIQFDCDVVGACLKTSWAPSSGSSGSTSGSSSSNNNNPPPPPPVFGCTNTFSNNFNPLATIDDGTCFSDFLDDSLNLPGQNQEEENQGLGDFITNLFGPGETTENPDNVPGEDSPAYETNPNENDSENSQNLQAEQGQNSFSDSVGEVLSAIPTITRENPAGVLASALVLMTVATIPLRKLADAPSRAIQLLVSAFSRKKKNWGIVFDAITKQPLDPVVVALKDTKGNVIQTSITDMEGRYGFIAPPGLYTIQANKADYIFPSKKFEGLTTDVVYDDVYLGQSFEVSSQGEIITKNIPLDPVKFNWNEFEKKRMGVGVASLRKQKINGVMFFVGFASSVAAIFLLPNIWNYIVLGLYIVFSILKIFGFPRYSGKVKTRSGKPLAYGVMHVFSKTLNKEVKKVVLDDVGNYYCLIRNGEYYVTFETRNSDNTYTPVFTSDSFTVRAGAIKKNFII